MNILHITPHLGGGVGKAHAAITAALPGPEEQTFLLLERARDRRFADAIAAAGARVVTPHSLDEVAELAAAADIVQFEFWNHPRLLECLARVAFPAVRSVFWSHISGLSKPLIQPALVEEAGRFVFTTEASRTVPALAKLAAACPGKLAVINSGFGLPGASSRTPSRNRSPAIAYLGTVDFVKMHPRFFDAIDRLDGSDIEVSVWGAVDPSSLVLTHVLGMRHPERVRFRGHTADPALALSEAEIFFYPLQPDHYGTGENALVEAMSLGLVPVVLNNPVEIATVDHGVTGFVGRSIEECAELLQMLMASPERRERVSRNAVRAVAATRTPARSAQQFMALWRGLLDEPKRPPNFRAVLGPCPADWFLATQCLPGQAWTRPLDVNSQLRSKGVLAHFENVFPGDPSLAGLAAGAQVRFG